MFPLGQLDPLLLLMAGATLACQPQPQTPALWVCLPTAGGAAVRSSRRRWRCCPVLPPPVALQCGPPAAGGAAVRPLIAEAPLHGLPGGAGAMAAALGHWLQLSSRRTMRGYQALAPLCCPARPCSSQPTLVHWTQRGLLKMYERFYDVESLFNWSMALRNWNLRRKNAYYGYTQKTYGMYIATAYYVLSQRGSVRFAGKEEWIRPNKRGKFSWDFLSFRDVPLEAVDASGTSITYNGLENLVCLRELKHLRLNNCPHIDDWCLSRLHVFGDSLEELELAGCPRVTERGLASLHHLKNLRLLDLSDLPSVDNRGLVRILLEETLPHCKVLGIEYEDGLLQQPLADQIGSSPYPHKGRVWDQLS